MVPTPTPAPAAGPSLAAGWFELPLPELPIAPAGDTYPMPSCVLISRSLLRNNADGAALDELADDACSPYWPAAAHAEAAAPPPWVFGTATAVSGNAQEPLIAAAPDGESEACPAVMDDVIGCDESLGSLLSDIDLGADSGPTGAAVGPAGVDLEDDADSSAEACPAAVSLATQVLSSPSVDAAAAATDAPEADDAARKLVAGKTRDDAALGSVVIFERADAAFVLRPDGAVVPGQDATGCERVALPAAWAAELAVPLLFCLGRAYLVYRRLGADRLEFCLLNAGAEDSGAAAVPVFEQINRINHLYAFGAPGAPRLAARPDRDEPRAAVWLQNHEPFTPIEVFVAGGPDGAPLAPVCVLLPGCQARLSWALLLGRAPAPAQMAGVGMGDAAVEARTGWEAMGAAGAEAEAAGGRQGVGRCWYTPCWFNAGPLAAGLAALPPEQAAGVDVAAFVEAAAAARGHLRAAFPTAEDAAEAAAAAAVLARRFAREAFAEEAAAEAAPPDAVPQAGQDQRPSKRIKRGCRARRHSQL
ncbi:hypothetical protein Rsub_12168 [Raphidocelis subcapitata]|uniref:Uncharacterized protein n=1 Tax=Raphidocelis subcapitata TaxID=307507 RepID=A0A2V0PHT4_9CHLO|nr:hypothetical protein Rsub_12168 [Raphidocelis subcapitata]|eukprot:GBF99364.1 hypothetical protein Rsub_12168 [Raphidocelis subcapitata]